MTRLTCEASSVVAGCLCHPSRRMMLSGGALLGLGAILGSRDAKAAPDAARRIDIHHHLTPPDYVAKVSPHAQIAPISKAWTVSKSLDDMDKTGVAKAMLSISSPGLWFGDGRFTAALARECNDYGAGLVRDNPGRFGLFAAIPMPDPDSALKEIAYALDTLHADGIGLYTSYGTKYLGDASFAPVFEELDRRRAVVYTHPLSPQCCTNIVPVAPDPLIEYGTDTTRTIASLVFSGMAARYPNVRLIFSHAGGTMPMLIERFQFQARDPAVMKKTGIGPLPLLKKFYYDTAQAANPTAMGALRSIVPVSQILFGSDFPYRLIEDNTEGLPGCGFTAAELEAINRGNAERLMAKS